MKKRILIIISRLHIGGAEKVARDIALHADRDAYQFDYLLFSDEIGGYEKQLEAVGCRMIRIPEPSCGYGNHIRTLRRIIQENRYDIVHVHTMFNCGWAMWVAKQCGVPVRIAHSHSALANGSGFVKSVYEKLMRHMILCCATDLVACGNKAGERLYGKKAFAKRGNLILNGIDTKAFRYSYEKGQAIREQLGLQNKFIVGHTGHLAEVKNQSFLIEMMPELLEKRADAVLLLLGEGEDRPMLEEKIHTLGLENCVIMTGNVNNVADYLSAMDVFAFPSLYEGMPLSILEVQANGLPCVISDRVPSDVFLTDLIHPLSLEDSKTVWIENICSVQRNNSEIYAEQMMNAGFDVTMAVEKIYKIYQKDSNHESTCCPRQDSI